MCYAIPGKVKRIEGKKLVVDYFGEEKKAYNELHNVKIGDYIYAQGGFVINVVPEAEALQVLKDWKDVFFALQQTDKRLSQLDTNTTGVRKEISIILDKAAEGRTLSKLELLKLMEATDTKELNMLFKVSNFLRQKYLKNSACVHGIIEISNYCKNDCSYCGIRASSNIVRYRMTDEEIYEAVAEAVNIHGFKVLLLQSGEDPEFTIDRLENIIRTIKERHPLLLFISFGELGKEGLKRLYDAGARGLLLRFETSDAQLYSKLHCGDKLKDRIQDIKDAYKMGYLILTGGLVGLPGQTKESLIDDVVLTKELHAEMFSFGPVLGLKRDASGIPKGPDVNEMLKVIALCRLVDPANSRILITTGFETLDANALTLGLMAGGNSMMLNVTPEKYRKLYSIYPDRAHVDEPIAEQIDKALTLLKDLGRAPTDLGVS
jgi:biotin synthase